MKGANALQPVFIRLDIVITSQPEALNCRHRWSSSFQNRPRISRRVKSVLSMLKGETPCWGQRPRPQAALLLMSDAKRAASA